MYSYYVFMCLLVFLMYLCINLHVYIVHMLYTLCITSCTPSLPVYIDILHTHISPCVYIIYVYTNKYIHTCMHACMHAYIRSTVCWRRLWCCRVNIKTQAPGRVKRSTPPSTSGTFSMVRVPAEIWEFFHCLNPKTPRSLNPDCWTLTAIFVVQGFRQLVIPTKPLHGSLLYANLSLKV